jgi:DNA-binding LacI/PurR family transcriptional regulator
MAAILNIQRPLKISPEANQRDAASDQIKHFIRAHRLQPGERLPTVRKMSETFGITRDAVWRALRQLQKEGWIELLPNKRYAASKELYTKILRSIRVRAIFSGEGYIYFSGFRRLADALTRVCHYHNIELAIDLLPLKTRPDKKVWTNCDLIMVDSDCSGRLLETFEEFPVPVIGLDANYSDRYHANIVTDHHLGGRMAAEAILKRGKRRASLVYHAGSEGNPRVAARLDGFRQTWLEAGRTADSLTIVPIPWSRSSFEIGLNLQAFLRDNRAHGTYFVTDGRLATNFLEVLEYQAISVPGEVAVVGYDGAQGGELTDPPMTTVQQDMERIAESAVGWVQKIAEGHEGVGVLERIAPLWVQRKSF